MASQTVRDVNASTPTTTQSKHVRNESLDTKHTDDTFISYDQIKPTQPTGLPKSPNGRKDDDASVHGGMRAFSTTTESFDLSRESPTTTQATTTMRATTPRTTAHTTTPATAPSTSTTSTTVISAQNEPVKASKPAGLKDELVGSVKKLTGTIVCSQSLKIKGEAQVEKGKREVAAARAQKENLSPHFARDGNNGFLGGMESVATRRMEEQERRALTGPRTDDAINADFVQQYHQRAQSQPIPQATSVMSESADNARTLDWRAAPQTRSEQVRTLREKNDWSGKGQRTEKTGVEQIDRNENGARIEQSAPVEKGERVETSGRMRDPVVVHVRRPLRENAAALAVRKEEPAASVGQKSPRTVPNAVSTSGMDKMNHA